MASHTFPTPNDPDYLHPAVLDLVPENVSFLASRANQSVPATRIGFNWHAASQHVSIENFQPPSYYEDYVMTATYSAKMQDLQKAQAQKLAGLHERGGPKSFVEIGCGDGSFMKYMRPQVPRVLGVEPSKRFAAEAEAAGFEVLIGYVGSQTSLTDEKFDSFVSRQVFEHLPDPVDVLRGVRQMLNPGAVGLIEVPNGQRALRMKRFFEFFPDHVNYYSVNSLVALASDAGFNVIGCHESFGGDYLELWLRYEPEVVSWFNEVGSHRLQVGVALLAELERLKAAGERVAVWGCGAKTLSIFAACPELAQSGVLGIIDNDPHKQGCFVPNTAISVVPPAALAELNPTVVLVLALSYREEIAASVRGHLPHVSQILTLDDHGAIVAL